MMPNISGESYAAPGKALASVGQAIGNLGEALAGQMNKEDAFRDQLEVNKFDGEESIRSIKSQQEFNREDPNGWAIEQHTGRTQRFNNMLASLRTDEGRKKAQLYWSTRGNNFYEHETSFEYGKRHEVIAKGTESAVAGEYAKIDYSGDDPERVVDSIKAAQRNASAIINSATLPKKDGLYAKSAEHAINSLRRAFTDETGHIKPEFYDAQEKLLQELGGATLPPKPGADAGAASGGGMFPVGGSMAGKSMADVPSAGKSPNSRDFGPDVRRTLTGAFRSHAGLDIPGKPGDPVLAVRPGTVIRMGQDQNGYGPFIDIMYDDGTIHRKAHLGNLDKGGGQQPFPPGLKEGDKVKPGQTVGFLGYSGNAGADFPHVHYEVFKDKASYDAGSTAPSRYGLQHRIDPREWYAKQGASQGGGGLTAEAPAPMPAEEFIRQQGYDPSNAVAGVRNNNPFNMKFSGSEYQRKNYVGIVGPSKNTDQGDPQIVFNSPEAGIASGIKMVVDKADRLTSVRDMLAGRGGLTSDKTSENRLGNNAADAIAKRMGVSPDAKIDFKNPEVLTSFAREYLKQEHGSWASVYSDDMIKRGVARVLGGSSPQATAAKPDKHKGILTSLDDAPTPQEVRSSGASVLDMDMSKPGAKLAVREAKQNGMKVAAYHEGAGGGASWGEGSRDLTKPAELAKLQEDAKARAKEGADYLHVDNLHDLKPDQLAKVARAVKDAGLIMIGKNNPQGWLDVIQKNPDLKPPYVVIEHGMKDKATIEAARKLSDAGVPVHFVEFGDPGIDKSTGQPRRDPVSTPDEAKAFAQANPWAAGVTHMKSQDSYNGRSSAGAQTFRAENTIPGAPVRVADSSGRIPASAGGNVDPAALRLREILINKQDEFAKERAVAEMRIVGDASASIDQIIKHAEAGGDVGNKQVDDITDKLFKMNPALVAKFGLEEKLTAALDFIDEANQYKLLNLQQQETVLSMRRKALAANLDKLPQAAVEAETQALKRFEALHNNAKEGMKKDLLSWAEKVGVQEVPETNWGDPASIIQRVTDAKAIAEHFGTDTQFFKEGDKKLLTDKLKAGGPEMLAALKVLYQGFGPTGNMEKAMAQLGKLAPEVAMAGWMMNAGHNLGTIDDLAEGIQRQRMREMGEKKIAPIKMADTRKIFIDTFGVGGFSRMKNSDGPIMETADAIYEARAARKGWVDPKPDEYKKILLEVVGQTVDDKGATFGGIQTVGGMFDKSVTDSGIGYSNSIVLPMNVKNTWSIGSPFGTSGGNSYKQLVDAIRIEDLVRQDRASSGPATGDGKPLGIDSVRRATPVTIGPGQYWLATGDPNSDDPKFIKHGTTGNNYVLDLSALEGTLKARRPDLYKGYQEKSWAPGVNQMQFTGDLQHGSDVMQGVQQMAPKNYQPGPAESANVIDERPSTTYTQGRNGQARQPNQIPMPTSDQTPDQLKGLLPN